jgi:hypothetical protein
MKRTSITVILVTSVILLMGCGQEAQIQPTQSLPVSTSTIGSPSATPTQDDTRVWNPKTILEAEQITGYNVYSPSYIPPDFQLGSSIMISRMGFGENSYKTVTRVWLWKGTRDSVVRFDLVENPKYFEIAGGQPVQVNGKPGQRAVQPESPDRPASLTLAWEQDGLFFALTGSLKDPLNEQELLKIAGSLEHLP